MTIVFIKEVEALDNPCVETATDVLGDFFHHVPPIFQPHQFRARRDGKDGLFALFAMISGLHRRSIPALRRKALALSGTA